MTNHPTPPEQIRLIAVDLDGTLLNSQHHMSPRNEAALKEAMRRGLMVILATGKTRYSAREVIAQLGLTTPGVYLQGLAIYDGAGQIMKQQTLNPEVIRLAAGVADERDLTIVAYSGVRALVRKLNFHTDRLVRYHEAPPDPVGSLFNVIDRVPVNKMMFIGTPDIIRPLRRELTVRFDGQATLVQSLSNDVEETVEILPPGASKGAGLKWLLDKLGILPQHVLAIGDGENDLEMVQMAGIGVAMANASPKLKAVAAYLTASNDEDGVAQAIETFAFA